MVRWIFLLFAVVVFAGCRSPYNVYAPYGPQCIPPPGTGAIGQPYYQAPYPGYQGYPGYPTTAPVAPYTGSTSRVPVPNPTTQSYIPGEGVWANPVVIDDRAVPVASATPVGRTPRPSGQSTIAGLQSNNNLNWGSTTSSIPLPGTPPPPLVGDVPTSLASAPPLPTYVAPIRPSAVRPAGYVESVPYYQQDYYGDPYVADVGVPVSYLDPYASTSVSSNAGWQPRR